MRRYIEPVLLLIVIALTVSRSSIAWADAGEDASRAGTEPNRASDASFDKRLPPVLPGEEVNDSGRKMNVWSTSGPVPVNPSGPPAAPAAPGLSPQGQQLPLGGVIVDRRDGRRR